MSQYAWYWPQNTQLETPAVRTKRVTAAFEDFITHVVQEQLRVEHGRLEIDILHAMELQNPYCMDRLILVEDKTGKQYIASLLRSVV